jgi:membrane-bound lytic murein transglycosylase D
MLPRETANYLPIILAMTIMAKNPADYGLESIQPDAPLEYDTIYLSSPTHLALIADLADRPVQSLRELNPAILKLLAPAGYPVHVPKGAGSAVMASLETIPAERRASWRIHRVNPAETVAGIARQYRTTEKSIAEANGSRASALDPEEGDVLLIPVSYPSPAPAPEVKARAKAKKKPSSRSRSRSKPSAKPKTRASARSGAATVAYAR